MKQNYYLNEWFSKLFNLETISLNENYIKTISINTKEESNNLILDLNVEFNIEFNEFLKNKINMKLNKNITIKNQLKLKSNLNSNFKIKTIISI